MNTTAAPVQHRSFGDRTGLILARAIQATLFGSAPIVLLGWALLVIIAIPIVLFLFAAVSAMVAMGITGRWEFDLLGVMLLAILVRTLPALAIFAALLWINDRILYSFNPRLPRDPRVRHGQ
ncbi:hypothetical protein [Microbacterium aurantiacum]|uniref:hypothetical protein n=1 Tax=Microbacterium aurantiacum TaxID=162393 RepID=UPI000C80281B|nr:hypothetical protein [Microbacterium aurantiacum]